MGMVSVPSYWPLLRAYHEVRAPLYRRIIAALDLPPDALILDAGCGDCFYARMLIAVRGQSTRVVAVDRNPAALPSYPQPHPSIRLCQSDLERLGIRHAAFDAIWLCRALHSAMDPVCWLAALVKLLRPAGKLIVVENDLANSPIVSWPAEFQRRIQAAHAEYTRQHSPDARALERYHAARHLPAWLSQVGLREVSVQTHVCEDVVPMVPETEEYWELVLDWLLQRTAPSLCAADRATLARLTDPAAPDYVLRQPGFACMELTTVACGSMP